MKRPMRLALLALVTIIVSCNLDGWGWLISSDMDDRFADNQSLLPIVPPTVPAPPFSFIVIADTHVFSGNDIANHIALLQSDILSNNDRFVLACGDLVQNGGFADFQTYAARIATLGVPVYSIPGNHDLYCNGWPNFRSVLGRSMYTFAAGPVRFIAIDSANGTLGGPQRAWLENVLTSKTEQYCVTFTHMEFFSDDITETQEWTDINETYSLMHLFETSGVNLSLCGHTHAYLARTIKGTNYVTAPAFVYGYLRVTVPAPGPGAAPTWQVINF